MRTWKVFLNLVIVVCLGVFLPSFANAKETLNRTVAVVNGEMITLFDLELQAAPLLLQRNEGASSSMTEDDINTLYRQVLDTMIIDLLLKKEAERLKIKVTDEEIENELNMMMERSRSNNDDLNRRLAAQGLSLDMLKEKIHRSIVNQRLINMIILRKIVIPKEEIEKFYHSHSDAFVKDRAIDVQLIVFDKKTNSQDITEKIKNGTIPFDEAARQYSIGPRAKEGGRMGTIYWSELSREWQEMIMNLQPGIVSNIFELDGLDAVLLVNSISAGASQSLEEAAPEIENFLKQPIIETRFTEYVNQLREKAVIDMRY